MSTYSFMDTQCTLASDDGVIDLGYGAGVADEGITIAMAGDANTMTIGADGEGMHSLSANKSGTVTVRLLK
ncbi:phage protein, partial [Acinetobacter baumannii]